MPKYLLEISHQNTIEECRKAVNIFKSTGSHFLTNADWGCYDNVHKAWIIVDVADKKLASQIVPPWYRSQTQIITLEKLAINNIENNLKHHQG
jgi:hypothetical protein